MTFLAEANAGKGVRFPACARLWLKFGIPALILVIFVSGTPQDRGMAGARRVAFGVVRISQEDAHRG